MTSSGGAGTQKHFSRMAESWIELYTTRPSFRERLDVVAAVLDPLLQPDDFVLDFGSGAGVFSMLAASRAALVVSVDQNESMLRSSVDGKAALGALMRARGLSPKPEIIRRVVGDVACLGAPGTVDLVLAIAVLEYVPEPAEHLRALAGVLRPGGHLLVTLPRPASLLRRFEKPLDRAAVGLGRLTGRRRMADREYSALRPQKEGDLPASFSSAGLCQVARWPVRLGDGRVLRHITPNEIFTLQKVRGVTDRHVGSGQGADPLILDHDRPRA